MKPLERQQKLKHSMNRFRNSEALVCGEKFSSQQISTLQAPTSYKLITETEN
jgi:hypothetical protein